MAELRKRFHPKSWRRGTAALPVAVLVGAAASALAQDRPGEGILESQSLYSAIFEVSPESGDLVGYVFRNDSPAGRYILKNCLPGMPCAVNSARVRPLDSAAGERLGFAEQPSGWLEVTHAQGARVVSAIEKLQSTVTTRHGVVAADRKNLSLLWKGKQVGAVGAGRVSIAQHHEWGTDDLLLVQNQRDVACPALYRFVLISALTAVTTPEFGTCSDVVYAFVTEGDGSKPQVVVRMLDHVSPRGNAADRDRAARTRIEYVYSDGVLTRDGRQVTGPSASGGGLR